MPVILGLTAFIVSFIVLGHFIGPAKCADGWASPSIGRPGACSWHGGVDRSGAQLRLFGSIAAGVLVGVLVHARANGANGTAPTSTSQSQSSGPHRVRPHPRCPKCRAWMVRRRAGRGSAAGQEFWGCSRYPRCKGTRSIEPPRHTHPRGRTDQSSADPPDA